MKLSINHLSKVEGHGKLYIDVQDKQVQSVQLQIYEGARYFEALVKGKAMQAVPHITSRICGICSQSHLLCAEQALEKALGISPSKQTQELRQVLQLASLIQSHVLHLYFLALPDYLGYDSAIAMAQKYKKDASRGLRLKRLANDIVTLFGGREIHSSNADLGGFKQLPSQEQIRHLLKRIREHKKDFEDTVSLFSKLTYPEMHRPTTYLAQCANDRVSYMNGDLYACGLGKNERQRIPLRNYARHLKETVVPYSNTKRVTIKDHEFMVGALARLNCHKKYLSRNAKRAVTQSGLTIPSDNPFHNNIAQAVELIDFYDKITGLLAHMNIREEQPRSIKPKAGRGTAAIEAPRGILIHEYETTASGTIKEANIIAPTTQNTLNIEEDIKELVTQMLKKRAGEKKIRHECEKLIRAYDPCISCSTHFLDIRWHSPYSA